MANTNAEQILPKAAPKQINYPPIEIAQPVVQPDVYESLNMFQVACVIAETLPLAKPKFHIMFKLIGKLCYALMEDLADCRATKCSCCNGREHFTKPKHRHHLYDALIQFSPKNIAAVIIGLIRALVPSVNKDFFQIAINSLVRGRRSTDEECENPTDVTLYLALCTFHADQINSPALSGCNISMSPQHRRILKKMITKNEIRTLCELKGGGYTYADDRLQMPMQEHVSAWYDEFFIGGAMLFTEVLQICAQLASRPEYSFLKTVLLQDMQYEITSIGSMLVGQQIAKTVDGISAYPTSCIDSKLSATERDAKFKKYKLSLKKDSSPVLLCEYKVRLGYTFDWIALCLLETLLIPKNEM